MTSFIFLIERIAFGLYILCAGGILFMARRLYEARKDLTNSQFKFERELALVRQATAITFGGLLIEFVIGVWAVANLMAPTLRDMQVGEGTDITGPTRFVTSTPAANAPVVLDTGGAVDNSNDPFATPQPTATAVGTIIPDAEDIVGCARDSAWMLIPGNGQLVFEATTIWGTASISNFAFYRFEIRVIGSGTDFAPLPGDYTTPVINGPLGDILPFQLPEGDYRFRLVVFDSTQTSRAVCEITIHISAPPPTPTPLSAAVASPTPSS